jgi:hypothetical protein
MARYPECRVAMSIGIGTGEQAACQEPAAPAQPCPAQPLTHRRPDPQRQDDGGTAGNDADLDAYIARMVGQAPPLSNRQRDRLALILRSPRRRYGLSAHRPLPGR